MMADDILTIRNLVKSYPGLTAVDDVSLSIKYGQCFALLGPNGAGKTTTIEVAEDIRDATSGDILYKGRPRDRRFKEEVGIQLQSTELPQFLTVGETLTMFHRLYKKRASLDKVIDLCRLADIIDRDNRKISGGQRQRLLLAMALINDPDLVFLDEPTTGMDPQARRHLWDIVADIKRENKTVVLTTHYMEEAELLSDYIAIMDHGKIIAEGMPPELLAKHCQGVFLSVPLELKPTVEEALATEGEIHHEQAIFLVDDVHDSLARLTRSYVNLTALTIRKQNLEDLFLKLTGR